MNLNHKISIVAHSAIIEYVALLQWNSAVAPATWLLDLETLFHIQISMKTNESKPWNMYSNL